MKKKIIPIIIALVLIIAIGALSFGRQLLDKYSYSKERYDLNTYFENSTAEDAAIIMDGKFMTERASVIDGVCYVALDTVLTYLNDRFYYDENNNMLLYTTANDILFAGAESNTVTDYKANAYSSEFGGIIPVKTQSESVLVALDYVRWLTDFEYTLYDEPYRVKITTKYDERTVAKAKKNTAVRHRGGVKSEILEDLKAGDKVTVLEQMDDWAKVITDDAVIGYVENKRLEDIMPELPIPEPSKKFSGCSDEYTHLTEDRKIVLGWHTIAGIGGNETLSSVTSITQGLNVISPTWFRLTDNEGNFESFAQQGYVDKAHNMGLEVWALVENIEHADVLDMDALLSDTTKRLSLAESLIKEVKEYDIDGINIDFEMLPTAAGADFSEFIRELSIFCRQQGIVLSIDNYVPIGGTGYYDRKTQGEVADYVIIMGYDEHYAGSDEAGSVSSINYVETGISMTIEEVNPNKVINAVPFYTRIWESDGASVSSQAVDMMTASEWLKNHNLTPEWDEVTCQNYASYKDGNKIYECWLEDEDSLKVKLNVMDNYNLGGVACWRLGFETADIWTLINTEYVNK